MNNSSDESSAEHPMDVDNFKTRKNATSNRNIFVPVKYVLKYMRFFNHFEEGQNICDFSITLIQQPHEDEFPLNSVFLGP